jgi:uncharacterized protein YbaP (TraB family)
MRNTSLLFFLFSVVTIYSQSEANPTVFPFPAEEQALLWKIEGKALDKPSYLFGTIHLIEKEYFFFPDKLKKLVEKSELLVMELPGLPNQKEAMKQLQLKDGTFFDFFTEPQTDSILQWAEAELTMNETQFRGVMTKMKPFVAIQLATQMHFLGKTESYEMTLEKLATEKEIDIKGLETLEEQMSLLDGLSAAQQTEMVMEMVRKPKEQYIETHVLEQLYVRQQMDSLYLSMLDSKSTLAAENNVFIDNRNLKWVPLIEGFIRDKKSIIAVGAGHLGGENGLVRLLQKKGYQLTPIQLQHDH